MKDLIKIVNAKFFREQLEYEELSDWGKFLFAWKFSFKMIGWEAIWRYPLIWFQMKRLAKTPKNKT